MDAGRGSSTTCGDSQNELSVRDGRNQESNWWEEKGVFGPSKSAIPDLGALLECLEVGQHFRYLCRVTIGSADLYYRNANNFGRKSKKSKIL